MNATKGRPGTDGRSAAQLPETQNTQQQLSPQRHAFDRLSVELIVQRFLVDVLGGNKVSLLSELVAPGYVAHLGHGDYYGPEGLRIDVATYWAAFPDLTVRLDDVFSCGNRAVRRFTIEGTQTAPFLGRLATHVPVTLHGIGIDRVEDGRLQESWVLVEFAPRAPPDRP